LSDSTSLDEKLARSGFQGLKNKIESPIIIKNQKYHQMIQQLTKNISKLLESYAKTTAVPKF
jgi:2C-methyl-D-erythritol 2,4-cyclodiphosphate synthase